MFLIGILKDNLIDNRLIDHLNLKIANTRECKKRKRN